MRANYVQSGSTSSTPSTYQRTDTEGLRECPPKEGKMTGKHRHYTKTRCLVYNKIQACFNGGCTPAVGTVYAGGRHCLTAFLNHGLVGLICYHYLL